LQLNDSPQLPSISEAEGPSSTSELAATPVTREEPVGHVDSSIPQSIASPLSGGGTFDDLQSSTTSLVKGKALPTAAKRTANTSQGTYSAKKGLANQ
jgi:hypothetical protein